MEVIPPADESGFNCCSLQEMCVAVVFSWMCTLRESGDGFKAHDCHQVSEMMGLMWTLSIITLICCPLTLNITAQHYHSTLMRFIQQFYSNDTVFVKYSLFRLFLCLFFYLIVLSFVSFFFRSLVLFIFLFACSFFYTLVHSFVCSFNNSFDFYLFFVLTLFRSFC